VLDASGSMQRMVGGRSLFERARERALKLAEQQIAAGGRVSILEAGRSPQALLTQPTALVGAIRAALGSVACSIERADLTAAVAMAFDQARRDRDRATVVHVITDDQAASWSAEPIAPPANVSLRFHPIDGAPLGPQLALADAGLVGPRPSVLRASLMAAIAVGALMLERPPAALNALAVAVALMVFSHPPVIADLGFQLSVAATFGLLVGTGPIARRLSRREKPSAFALSLASSLAAQLAVLPIAAPTFALVHPASPLVHLLAVPWLLLCLPAGAGALAVSIALPSFDGSTVMRPLVLLVDLLADLPPGPFATWPVSITPPAALLLVAALVPAIWLPRSALRKLALPALLLAGLASAQLFSPRPAERVGLTPPVEAAVTAIDVGQGDALLLRSPGVSILVDGGGWRRGDSASRLLLPPLADLGVRRLDAVVLTHPDGDHCDGLRDLASYLSIGEVWSAPGWAEPCAGELLGRRGPVRVASGAMAFAAHEAACGIRTTNRMQNSSIPARASAACGADGGDTRSMRSDMTPFRLSSLFYHAVLAAHAFRCPGRPKQSRAWAPPCRLGLSRGERQAKGFLTCPVETLPGRRGSSGCE